MRITYISPQTREMLRQRGIPITADGNGGFLIGQPPEASDAHCVSGACHCAKCTARDRARPVSDSELRSLPLAAVVKLAGPKVSPSQEEVSLGQRAGRELRRRFLLTGDTREPDPANMRTRSIVELVRVSGPRVAPSQRDEVLAKRALSELFRRRYGGK